MNKIMKIKLCCSIAIIAISLEANHLEIETIIEQANKAGILKLESPVLKGFNQDSWSRLFQRIKTSYIITTIEIPDDYFIIYFTECLEQAGFRFLKTMYPYTIYTRI